MSLFQRHQGFLQSLLREANAKRRNVMLDLANKKQIKYTECKYGGPLGRRPGRVV